MTGDGVNDVLALKEADCSVAMASGSDAARNVSQLVLVNNDFGAMPSVVAEGRRTINNLERSSALYLVKTIYSVILSIFFIFFRTGYPFEPIQLTLVGALTVGLPSFVLALQPNKDIVKGNFTVNIIARSLPTAFLYFGRYNITRNFKVYDRYATGTVFNSLRISYCIFMYVACNQIINPVQSAQSRYGHRMFRRNNNRFNLLWRIVLTCTAYI